MQTRVGGVTVSLPDATRSDRVYPLLQNLDLENLAFATVQGVGNTLAIEEMNEDELRRLVLVNLARLTVSGEWNGLLTAPAGLPDAAVIMKLPPISNSSATNLPQYAHISAPYGTGRTATQAVTTDAPLYLPFTARRTDTFDDIYLYVTTGIGSAANVDLGLYSDNDGQPGTLLGKATVDVNTSGQKSAALVAESGQSLSSTAGTQYWLALVRQSGVGNFTVQASDRLYFAQWAWGAYATSYGMLSQSGSDNTLPATAAFSTGYAYNMCAVGVNYGT